MEKENKMRILYFFIGAAVLFFGAPLLFGMLPENIAAMGSMILMLLVNHIFLAVVGWQSNYIPKWGVYLPGVMVLLYLASEFIYFGQASWMLEANYLETGYIAFFLKKLLTRRQTQLEKKNKTSFPKGLGRK